MEDTRVIEEVDEREAPTRFEYPDCFAETQSFVSHVFDLMECEAANDPGEGLLGDGQLRRRTVGEFDVGHPSSLAFRPAWSFPY